MTEEQKPVEPVTPHEHEEPQESSSKFALPYLDSIVKYGAATVGFAVFLWVFVSQQNKLLDLQIESTAALEKSVDKIGEILTAIDKTETRQDLMIEQIMRARGIPLPTGVAARSPDLGSPAAPSAMPPREPAPAPPEKPE